MRRAKMWKNPSCEVCGEEEVPEKQGYKYLERENITWWVCSLKCLDILKKERAKMVKKVDCQVCGDNVLLLDAIKDKEEEDVFFCGFECESIYKEGGKPEEVEG